MRGTPSGGERAEFLLGNGRMQRPRLACLILPALAACGYAPGSYTSFATGRFAGERQTVGCLDVAVERVTDAAAEGPVLGLTFANRCDTRIRVDLGAIEVIGRFADGHTARLRPYDPDRQIRPGRLEARTVGRENIEYQGPGVPAQQPYELCADLARVDAAAPALRPVIVCVAGPGATIASRGGAP